MKKGLYQGEETPGKTLTKWIGVNMLQFKAQLVKSWALLHLLWFNLHLLVVGMETLANKRGVAWMFSSIALLQLGVVVEVVQERFVLFWQDETLSY